MRIVNVKKYSPVLDAILYGGSSVAMNLIELSRSAPKETWLFSSGALNHGVIFKYPNFPERLPPPRDLSGWSGRPQEPEDFRPIETGIYLPYDSEHPRDGGSAFYLRQKNYGALMQEYLGLRGEAEQQDLQRDTVILNLLDTIPSLDPFLVKDCLDAHRIPFREQYLRLDPVEVARIRQVIAVKITEIVEKAFSADRRTVADKDKVIEALWDPALPEARDFIAAFGIAEAEAPLVFSAWKGITFYQVQLRDLAPRMGEALRWFGSPASVPFDSAAVSREYREQLRMFKGQIARKLIATGEEARAILREYEACHQDFLAGRPRKLVAFLKDSRRTYWILASCISALQSALNILFNDVRAEREHRLSFDEEQDMFKRIDVVLNRKREAPKAF
ncbi:hypothetical protein [Azospirillum halopraeferens]|uniref:hypothetical protein n=1 Tax=Azospirillum halopraeferens TaxID=34010 RepID=UPI000427E0E1|nr:hypothetical protein [Azospirillum halopraeferens]